MHDTLKAPPSALPRRCGSRLSSVSRGSQWIWMRRIIYRTTSVSILSLYKVIFEFTVTWFLILGKNALLFCSLLRSVFLQQRSRFSLGTSQSLTRWLRKWVSNLDEASKHCSTQFLLISSPGSICACQEHQEIDGDCLGGSVQLRAPASECRKSALKWSWTPACPGH